MPDLKFITKFKVGSVSFGTSSMFSRRKEMNLSPAFTARVTRVLSSAVSISWPSLDSEETNGMIFAAAPEPVER